MKDFYVFIGNFGSGKTELALNMAINSAAKGRTLLVDMDMVNTYFRASERRALLVEAGVTLISPNYVSTNIEALSLPPEVASAFHSDWDTVVFDAGGDPAGATSLGQFRQEFDRLEAGSLRVYNIINVRRPMSGTAERIISLMEDMQRFSRLTVTGLVNNSNLAVETTPEDLWAGYLEVRRASELSGVPVAMTCGLKSTLEGLMAMAPDMAYVGHTMEIFPYMHRDWDRYISEGL